MIASCVMKRAALVWLTTVTLVLSGCATVDPKVIESRVAGKSILVASTVDSTISLLWVGTTVFNNESGEIAVPDWALDKLVVETAIRALTGTTRYQAVVLAQKVDRANETFLTTLRGKADFLLLFESGASEDRVFGTNQIMRGVGVYQRSMFGSQPRTLVHAALKGEVFDLRTSESLGAKSNLQFAWTFTPLESGPKIAVKAEQEIRSAVTTRTEFAVLGLIDALGLR